MLYVAQFLAAGLGLGDFGVVELALDPPHVGRGEHHLPDVGDAAILEEHVLGAAQADALCAKAAGAGGVVGVIGVGPHLQAAELVGPGEKGDQVGFLFELGLHSWDLTHEGFA